MYEWKVMEYDFPSNADRETALANGQYIIGRGVPIDVDVHYNKGAGKSRIFVSIPRFLPGIPITFGTVSRRKGPGGYKIKAYPDYSWHVNQGFNCDGITSVFRVRIDECNRLWVLDSGKIGNVAGCPAQLLVFNLDTDSLIRRYKFPPRDVRNATLLVTPVVDIRDDSNGCINTFVYMADSLGFAILVYDMYNNRSWRTEHRFMRPEPRYSNHTVAGDTFTLNAGVFGMSLSPSIIQTTRRYGYGIETQNDYDGTARNLYFHAIASVTENLISTKVLNDESSWRRNVESYSNDVWQIGNRPTTSNAQDVDRNGNLYFGLLESTSIVCWDSTTPYNPQNMFTIAQDERTLQFPSGVKIVDNLNDDEELWILTDRFQKYLLGTLNNNSINFRIQATPLYPVLNNGRCDHSVQGGPNTTPDDTLNVFIFSR